MKAPDGDELLVRINPQLLTPASTRALRKLYGAWLLTILAVTLAFYVFVAQAKQKASCDARRYTWDIEYRSAKRQNQPLPLDGLTGDLRRAREQNNEMRADNLAAFKEEPRPSC